MVRRGKGEGHERGARERGTGAGQGVDAGTGVWAQALLVAEGANGGYSTCGEEGRRSACPCKCGVLADCSLPPKMPHPSFPAACCCAPAGSLGGRRPGPPAALFPTVLGQVYQRIDPDTVRRGGREALGASPVCVPRPRL